MQTALINRMGSLGQRPSISRKQTVVKCIANPSIRVRQPTTFGQVQKQATPADRQLLLASAASSGEFATSGGDDSGSVNGNTGGGGGGDGKGDGAGGMGGGSGAQDPVALLLAAAGKTAADFPADFAVGLTSGKVTLEVLQRYLELQGKVGVSFLMQFPGFRERLLADPAFLAKLGIELGIGICTKLSAEYAKRQDTFYKELDFVSANVLMALLADFMLVWLPAPTLAFGAKKSAGGLFSMFAGCPDNAFQRVQPGMEPFTMGQRMGAVLRNGIKLFGVGITASFIGVAVTNSLLYLRTIIDPTFLLPNKPQDVLATSAAYGVYMATSSNIRYQLLAGVIEERGIETMFKGNYKVTTALSFIVRTANTFLGSLLWVDFVRLLGMQKSG